MVNLGIEVIASNLSMGHDIIIFFALNVGCLIFYAAGFKEGITVQMFLNALLALWFYKAGWTWYQPLVAMFIMLIIMAFSLYFTSRAANERIGAY